MNERDLFRALGDIDEDLLTGAEKTPKKNPWRRYIPTLVAACLCIAALFLGVKMLGGWGMSDGASMERVEDMANGPQKLMEVPAESGLYTVDGDVAPDKAPGVTGGNPQDPMGILSNGTEPAEMSGTYPGDLTIRLEWDGGFYDSESQSLVEYGGLSCAVKLTDRELSQIWQRLCLLEPDTGTEPGWKLVWTTGGQTYTCTFSGDATDSRFRLAQEIKDIIYARADSLR